jgi:hypothetical protein
MTGSWRSKWRHWLGLEFAPVSQVERLVSVAGSGRRSVGETRRTEFARWARYEVVRNENSWLRVGGGEP